VKALVIGCGGVGSFLIEELAGQIEKNQLEFEAIDIADGDIVEYRQLEYQNFTIDDVGKNKAEVLAERYRVLGVEVFKPIKDRITKINQLKGYDLIVLCVDNEPTREMVIRYCHRNKIEFIDLRATGRRVFAMPKLSRVEDNLKFVDTEDVRGYSCQEEDDLRQGWIQLGNKLSALIGVQMLMNLQRGYLNRVVSLVV